MTRFKTEPNSFSVPLIVDDTFSGKENDRKNANQIFLCSPSQVEGVYQFSSNLFIN